MKTDEAKQILAEFGKVFELVSNANLFLFPSMHYPISLLPYTKRKIIEAQKTLLELDSLLDKDYLSILKQIPIFLDSFIDDRKAFQKNATILNENKYWEALKNNK